MELCFLLLLRERGRSQGLGSMLWHSRSKECDGLGRSEGERGGKRGDCWCGGGHQLRAREGGRESVFFEKSHSLSLRAPSLSLSPPVSLSLPFSLSLSLSLSPTPHSPLQPRERAVESCSCHSRRETGGSGTLPSARERRLRSQGHIEN